MTGMRMDRTWSALLLHCPLRPCDVKFITGMLSPPRTPGRVNELRCGGHSPCDAANLHHTSIHSPYLVPTLPCHTASRATTSAQLLTNLLIFSRIGCPHLVSINRAVSVGVSWHSAYKLMPYCHWVIISVFGFGIGSNVRLLFGFGYRPNFSISAIISAFLQAGCPS